MRMHEDDPVATSRRSDDSGTFLQLQAVYC